MKRAVKIIGLVLVAAVLALAAAVVFAQRDYDPRTLLRAAPIGTGYAAKMLCSGVFVSGRQPESLWSEDLELMRDNLVRGKVNYPEKSAVAHVLGFFFKQTALYRGDCGCTLALGVSAEELKKQCAFEIEPAPGDPATMPWPMGDVLPATTAAIDQKQLNASLDWAFSEPVPEHPMRTRAVIVLYDGQIVAERYAPGYSRDTRLLGWSMTKSVISALIGVLVGQGKLDIFQPAPISEWRSPGDPRAKITTDQLLRMSSGLKFLEEYEDNPDTDVGFMFFTEPDMAKFAAEKPLEAEPDTKFSYSSGTTMILARIIRQTVGGAFQDYIAFPHRELFHKLGMRSALIETDTSGTMVGAGFMYATARDWARFGLLYYNDGVWNGERILPEGWVQYTRTPTTTDTAQDPAYGAQFWLNTPGPNQWLPNCPEDTYSTWGHEGEFVTIVPSRKTIIVRLGQTFDEEKNWNHDFFVSSILKAMPD